MWNGGYDIDTRQLADVLLKQGFNAIDIRGAFIDLNFDARETADALADGASFNYTEVAEALYTEGFLNQGLTARQLADILWDEGATQYDIGSAFFQMGFSARDTAYAIKWGVTKNDGTNLNYTDVALALANTGFYDRNSLVASEIADIIWNQSSNPIYVSQAIKNGIGTDMQGLVSALRGITSEGSQVNFDLDLKLFSIINSGVEYNSRMLAHFLREEGGDLGTIWELLGRHNLINIDDPRQIADTFAEGAGFDATEIARLLQHIGVDKNEIADILWDEGFSQTDIGWAFFHAGFSAKDTASAVWSITDSNNNKLNSIDVAKALYIKGFFDNGLTVRTMSEMIYRNPSELALSLKGIGIDLKTIADAVQYKLGGNSWWNSSFITGALKQIVSDGGTLVSSLLSIGWDYDKIARSMASSFLNEEIAGSFRAIGVGIADIGRILWNLRDITGITQYRIGVIAWSLGDKNDVVSALVNTGMSKWVAEAEARRIDFKENVINPLMEKVEENAPAVAKAIDDNSKVANALASGNVEAAHSIVVNAVNEALSTENIQQAVFAPNTTFRDFSQYQSSFNPTYKPEFYEKLARGIAYEDDAYFFSPRPDGLGFTKEKLFALTEKSPNGKRLKEGETIGFRDPNFPDEFKVDKIFDYNESDGFYAVGLTNTSGQGEPILVIRGTAGSPRENAANKITDWLGNLTIGQIGNPQFQSHKSEVAEWLKKVTDDFKLPPSIVGHSLGGALAQSIAADYTSQGNKLTDIVTFNSPGINYDLAKSFVSSNARGVMHYVALGDVVSLVGDEFIKGDVTLLDWSLWDRGQGIGKLNAINIFGKHGGIDRLNPDGHDVLEGGGKNLISDMMISSDELSSDDFSYWRYPSPDWKSFNGIVSTIGPAVEGIAILPGVPPLPPGTSKTLVSGLINRATAESSRQIIGSTILPVVNAIQESDELKNNPLKYIKQWGKELDEWKNEMVNKLPGAKHIPPEIKEVLLPSPGAIFEKLSGE